MIQETIKAVKEAEAKAQQKIKDASVRAQNIISEAEKEAEEIIRKAETTAGEQAASDSSRRTCTQYREHCRWTGRGGACSFEKESGVEA